MAFEECGSNRLLFSSVYKRLSEIHVGKITRLKVEDADALSVLAIRWAVTVGYRARRSTEIFFRFG